jgi:hypothetical protein
MRLLLAGARSAAAGAAPAAIAYKQVRLVNPLTDTRVQGVDVAAVPYDPNTPPTAQPAHIEFRFSHYYPTLFPPATVAAPTVYVYRTATFAAYKWDVAEHSLAAILHTHPNLAKTKQLPLLPSIPAGQVFHAQAAYRSFASGQGISYLAYYAQDVSPVTANRLIYAFQGISTDGRYYLSAVFPVHVAFLPSEMPSNLDYNAFARGFEQYLSKLVQRLNAPSASQNVTPRPAMLNALMASVAIGG